MIEIAPNIFYIPGNNASRFPYCACLYLKGRRIRALIDAGMGSAKLEAARKMGIDLLILSHCHIDHRLTRKKIPDVPVWCHEKEAAFLKDREYFYNAMGLKRSGLELSGLFDFARGMFGIETDHKLVDGERIDLGGITLETIHTPGHTPGHLSFFIPEADFLFSGDVDLTPFGPFYGHDFADLGEFIQSIERLKQLNARIAATGHAGPFEGNIAESFRQYGEVVTRRDRLLLENLTRPRPLEYFKGRNLFYRTYPDYPDLIKWFERVHIEKHLSRLACLGKVKLEENMWVKI